MKPFDANRDNPLVLALGPAASSLSPRSHGEVVESRQSHVLHVGSHAPSVYETTGRQSTQNALSLRSLLQVLFGRWRRIALVAACVIAVTAVAVLYLPPRYRSEAKLLVRLGRESVVIDPTARSGQFAMPIEGRDKEIKSEVELLKSRKLVESIVASLGADRILSTGPGQRNSLNRLMDTIVARLGAKRFFSITPARRNTPENVVKAITFVEEELAIEAVPDSNILSIRFDGRDPELARDLVARLIEVYLDERAEIYRERGDLKFFQDQLATARLEQAAVQRQIQELRDSSGVADTTQQRTTLLKRIDQIQQDIDTDRAERVAQAASTSAVTNQVGSANAIRQHQALIARDSVLDSMIQSLQAQKAEAIANLTRVNKVEVEMQKLQQEATLAATRVTQYADAYEQTRINREMGQQKLSNISIAEPPVLPLKPKAPSRALLAIAGLFLAVTLGLGSACVAEAMDHTLRRADDLHALGLSQIVSIPRVRKRELKARLRFRRVAKAAPVNGHASCVAGRVNGHAEPVVALGGAERYSGEPTRPVPVESIVHWDLFLPRSNGAPKLSGRTNGNANQNAMAILEAAIRPARPLAISPKLLARAQGVVELLIPAGDDAAPPRLIGVVGPRPGQGASTVALHLAVALVHRLETGLHDPLNPNRVLLLDADVESCRASALAGVQVVRRHRSGVSAHLSAPLPLSNTSGPIWQDFLDVLTAGMLQDQSFLGAQVPQLLRAIGQRYRNVVIDLPSMADNESSARFAGLCDAVVLVCKANELRIHTAQQTICRLRAARANVPVAVLNQRRYPVPEWIYRRS